MNLEELSAYIEIKQVLYMYCRGVDRGDAELIRSVYHPDAIDEHGPFWQGAGMDFADMIVEETAFMGVIWPFPLGITAYTRLHAAEPDWTLSIAVYRSDIVGGYGKRGSEVIECAWPICDAQPELGSQPYPIASNSYGTDVVM